jgi:hypothetical protein
MSKNDFKLVINSKDAIAGTLTDILTYQCDFSIFKKGYYSVTFSFCSGNNDIDPSYPAEIFFNLTGSSNVYKTTSTGNNNFLVSSHLGLLYPIYLSAVNGHLQASAQDNLPTVMMLPSCNQFQIVVKDLYGNAWVDQSLALLAPYFLVLYFKYIE